MIKPVIAARATITIGWRILRDPLVLFERASLHERVEPLSKPFYQFLEARLSVVGTRPRGQFRSHACYQSYICRRFPRSKMRYPILSQQILIMDDTENPGIVRDHRSPGVWTNLLSWLVIGLATLAICIQVSAFFAGPGAFSAVWEDACMFSRYATNFRQSGTISWDPYGAPVYGLTSPFYFLTIVAPLSWLMPRSPLLLATSGSLICGCSFVISLFALTFSSVRGSKATRMGATAIVFISLVDASAGFATHLVSGMDTFFGLLYFAIYLLVTTYAERSPSITSFLIAGVIGGLAYGCRPDLVIFTVAVPLFPACST